VHIDLKALPWTINEGIYNNLQEEKIAYSKYDKVICVSNSVKKIMTDEYELEHVETIYNPIDTHDIIEKSKKTTSISVSNGFNLISIGRLVPQKGYDLLIPIVSKLIKDGINVHLYILGTGIEQQNLEKIISKEGINNHTHLLGFQENPYSIMEKMDLFVCSSRSEGYSLVIAEALTLGVPVISMNCSGPNELLDNNKYGRLCNSYEELYQSIKSAITDKDYYQDLKEKATKRKDFFDINTTMQQIDNLLSES
jgi:glycosyltransferase involved in cell wall biosynthesis